MVEDEEEYKKELERKRFYNISIVEYNDDKKDKLELRLAKTIVLLAFVLLIMILILLNNV